MKKRPVFYTFVALLLYGFYFLFFRPHDVNHNRYELAKRAACDSNLKSIARELKDREVVMSATNFNDVVAILRQLDKKCPSVPRQSAQRNNASYLVKIDQNGYLYITEHTNNHNPYLIPRTKLPWVIHGIDKDLNVTTIYANGSEKPVGQP